MRYILFLAIFITGCAKELTKPALSTETSSCKGTYYTETNGLKKWKEEYNPYTQTCLKENLELPLWFKSLEIRTKAAKKCKPQPNFGRVVGIAANNFYKYRDGRELIDLNGTTGEYRRIFLAEEKKYTDHGTLDVSYTNNGFVKELGCFVTKEDPTTGNWLYLDAENLANSDYFQTNEIYNYTKTTNGISLDRKDDTDEWSGQHCPTIGTPWGYCDRLRTGNIMFGPDLTINENQELLNEAILIRTKFNFDSLDLASFEALWKNLEQDILYYNATNLDLPRANWKYDIDFVYSAPKYTWQAMVDYIYGYRPTLPESTIHKPLVCYPGTQTVTLANGNKGKVHGEICYEDGKYTFTTP